MQGSMVLMVQRIIGNKNFDKHGYKKGRQKQSVSNRPLTHHQSEEAYNGALSFGLDLSELTHRESLKRSLVGVGGLEVRGRQRLALTLVR